jgi:hypothetical protein
MFDGNAIPPSHPIVVESLDVPRLPSEPQPSPQSEI